MKKNKLVAWVLLALVFALAWPGGSQAQPRDLEAFMWTSQMQAHLLRGVIRVYGDVVLNLKGVEQDFQSQLNAFDELAVELKPFLEADQAHNLNTLKYYNKLLTQKRTLEKIGKQILERRNKGQKIVKADIEPLEKAAFQTVYEARQLMRHLVRQLDLESIDQKNRERICEVLVLTEMQGHLLNSIREAFADNLHCNSSPAESFWLSLSSFDILATVYKSGSAAASPEKAKVFQSLVALKHDVLMEGEAMYLVAKTCKHDLEAARNVEKAAGTLMPIFQTLLQEAMK